MRLFILFISRLNHSTIRNLLLPLTGAMVIALLTSCSNLDSIEIWRQIPIQMTRVYQTDSYRQTFLLGEEKDIDVETLTIEERQKYDARMDRIFIQLVGARNWQYLKNLYGVSSIRNELIERRVHMEGLVNLVAYLDPMDHGYVIMEGNGRFFAVRDKTDVILMSGDYHIVPQRYAIEDFQSADDKSGCIPLEVTIYTTRIPGKSTYYKDAIIQYDLNIKQLDDDGKVISVDYSQSHKGYIDLNNNDKYEKSELFASLMMNTRYHQAKLLDLSGLGFVKKNYQISKQSQGEAEKAARIDSKKTCISELDKQNEAG